ncbi:MAG: outer membrane beta-barrel protein [Lutibacter sp.]|nr:outer membrane beta-barrel protein [Lutibacter sp.]MBP9600928.1 outer membrane beta-barrel protein [Lutibacter sp.]
MKKIIILCNTVFFMSFFSINAQSSFGVKGGINYNSNGNLDEFVSETEQIIKDKGERKAGYSVGIYGKIDLGSLYIRPEVLYTKTTSEYALNSVNEEFNMRKISAPLLVGLELIGPLSVFAGPSFQYIMDNDFNGLDFDAIEKEFTVGLNIGVALQLGRIGIDARYERGLNKNEAKFNDNNTNFRLDTRPEQLIFSISYSLTKANK